MKYVCGRVGRHLPNLLERLVYTARGAGPRHLPTPPSRWHVAFPVCLITPLSIECKFGTCASVGAGEYIIRTMLARAVAEAIQQRVSGGLGVDCHDILHCVLVENFWGEPQVPRCVNGWTDYVVRTLSE